MSPENLETFKNQYQAGKYAFERGQYREAVQHLEQAIEQIAPQSHPGGEAQIWLITAYEAAGQRQEAIALCRQLTRHPYREIRKQSRRILYILEAPRLTTRPEWLIEIPDLTNLEETEGKNAAFSTPGNNQRPRSQRPKSEPDVEPIDLTQVNTKDNQFIWFALVVIALTIGGLVWLS